MRVRFTLKKKKKEAKEWLLVSIKYQISPNYTPFCQKESFLPKRTDHDMENLF